MMNGSATVRRILFTNRCKANHRNSSYLSRIMKRAQFIEWGIIVVAIIFGYRTFESIISLLVQIIFTIDERIMVPEILKTLLAIAINAVAFIVLIKNSKRIAGYLDRPATEPADALKINIGKRSLLQVILVAICLETILSDISYLLLYVFDAFKNHDGFGDFFPGRHNLVADIIQVVLAVIIIAVSKKIADVLIPRNEADELVFDSTPEN